MFKPGQKYTYKDSKNPCVFIGYTTSGAAAIFENLHDMNVFKHECSLWNNWKEYKEPIVHTRYVHWFKKSGGELLTSTTANSSPENIYSNSKWIQTDKVQHVEG